MRSTLQPVRSSKFGSARSTGSSTVCGDDFAKCSHAKRSQYPQNVHVCSLSPSGFVYGWLRLHEGCGYAWYPRPSAALRKIAEP
jgi:hypothetical protein